MFYGVKFQLKSQQHFCVHVITYFNRQNKRQATEKIPQGTPQGSR